MNPTSLPPFYGYIVGQTGLFNIGMTTGLREGKLERDRLCHVVCVHDMLHELGSQEQTSFKEVLSIYVCR